MDSAEKGERANQQFKTAQKRTKHITEILHLKEIKHGLKRNKTSAYSPTIFDPRKVTYYDPETDGNFEYKSRPHRKHRFLRFLPADLTSQIVVPPAPKVLLLDIFNISWWVAVIFCVGTACWVVSGHFGCGASRRKQKCIHHGVFGVDGYCFIHLWFLSPSIRVFESR